MELLRNVLHQLLKNNLTQPFDQLVSQCQSAMFCSYDSKPEVPLYDPTVMRDFCEKHSPGLFDLLLKAITRDDNRLSSDRESRSFSF